MVERLCEQFSEPRRRMLALHVLAPAPAHAERFSVPQQATAASASSSAPESLEHAAGAGLRTSDSGPPDGVVRTGTPEASASAATIPKPSCRDGEDEERRRPGSAGRPRAEPVDLDCRPAPAPQAAQPTRRTRAPGTSSRRAGGVEQERTFLRGSSARPTNRSTGRSRSGSPPGTVKPRGRRERGGRRRPLDRSSPPGRPRRADGLVRRPHRRPEHRPLASRR